jgi:SAM-dependent methyltransferase
MLDEGAQVVGLDLSPAMIEEARARCGGRGQFLVADIAESIPLDPRSFDGITCSLVLHYLENWFVPLRSFATLLRPGGWVVLSLDHPFGPPLPGQRGGYFESELVTDIWEKGDVEVIQHFWHRPLGAVVGAFADAGFVIDRICETQPDRDTVRRFPRELARAEHMPSFIVYRLLLRDAGAPGPL